MNLDFIISLLPFAFALHNLEEALGMEKWTKFTPSFIHRPFTTRQFGIAVLLFTVLGFIVVFAKGLYKTEELYYMFVSGFAGILLLNVFIPHLVAVIYMKKYAPGIISALLVNLPLSAFVLTKIKNAGLLTTKQVFLSVITGGVIGVVLTFGFLKIGAIIGAKRNDPVK
ncbi:MAG: HXXEE domain-containing protein [Bacteroidales bacterium]|nr:HXXEE domain-containing protein [Bacteroidales bacterium]